MREATSCTYPAILATIVAVLAVSLTPYLRTTLTPSEDNVPLGSGLFFDRVAPRYDFLNRAISLGLDQSWRRATAAAAISPSSPSDPIVLDVATGTGDLALILASGGAFAETHALDPSLEMLSRLATKPHGESIRAVAGSAESLPYSTEKFDAVTVAFGVRNFADRTRGLAEMGRVLKSGGRLVVLEASVPEGGGLVAPAARFFIRVVMPAIGAVVSGRAKDYRYLSSSMAAFPGPEMFQSMLEEAGFVVESHQRLWPSGAGPDLYVAVKK